MQKDNHSSMLPATPPSAISTPVFDYYGPEGEQKTQLRDYWHILIKRRWWAICFLLASIAAMVLVIVIMTPIYKSTSVLQIIKDNPTGMMDANTSMSSLLSDQYDKNFYETQFKILSSRSLAQRVIKALNLEEHEEFQAIKKRDTSKSPIKLESDMIEFFLKRLGIEPIKNSYLVEISYRSSDKHLAQQVVDVISQEYMQLMMECRNQSFGIVKKWLEKQLQQLASKVDISQKKLYGYGKASDILPTEEKDNVVIQKFIDLGGLLTKAESEAMAKSSQYKQIKEKGVDAPLITNNPLIQSLRQDQVGQEAKVASISKIYKEDHPQLQAEQGKLREMRSRLNGEIDRMRTSVKADYEAASRTENMLRDAFNEQKMQVGDLQDRSIQYKILKRDVETNEGLYQALLSRMKETSVASTMITSNVSVIDPADLPYKPARPRKLMYLTLATLFGLIGGVWLALLAEHFDDTIRTTEELESVCQLPSLGLVPLLKSENKSLPQDESDTGLVTVRQPKSIVSEAIRQVRTSLMLSISGGPPGSILVTSPNPSEGKSTMAINLAACLAMEGRQVLLIDADMRKPKIHRVFKQLYQPGLSNVLTGNATEDQVIRSTEVPNLSFIAAGAVPPSPTDLLNSSAFKDLLDELRHRYQHLIIDTPPLLGFADARVLSTMVDGVLLVLKHNSTPREAGKLARQLLNQVNARVIGAVLNQVSMERLSYGGYYYGYFKDYHKYYRAYHEEKGIDSPEKL